MVPWEAGEGVLRAREAMQEKPVPSQGHRFLCRKCGYGAYTSSSRPMSCPKCGSPMVQVF